ncbi:MAG: hypothetical protein HS126_35635 [Anaerolineales bacterium]|nr:hypothetical protein [Anaerolineales bacterium]
MVRIETNEIKRKRSGGGGSSLTRRRPGLSGQTTKRVSFTGKTGIGLNNKNRLAEHNLALVKPVFNALKQPLKKWTIQTGFRIIFSPKVMAKANTKMTTSIPVSWSISCPPFI